MKRYDEMFEYAQSEILVVFSERLQKVKRCFLQNETEIIDAFHDCMSKAVADLKRQQMNAQKSDISYIVLSYLLSNIYTGKCEIKIDFYDARLYGDLADFACYWDYGALLTLLGIDDIQADEERIIKHIMKKFIRFKGYEVLEVHNYYSVYIFIIWQFLLKKMFMSDKVQTEIKTLSGGKVTVMYGSYLHQTQVIGEFS